MDEWSRSIEKVIKKGVKIKDTVIYPHAEHSYSLTKSFKTTSSPAGSSKVDQFSHMAYVLCSSQKNQRGINSFFKLTKF